MNAILSIESSCDDTGASVIIDGTIISNVVQSQIIHESFGGVVPELASRAHQLSILPVIQTALERAKIQLSDLSAVAVTKGPGLLGSLMVGASMAKSIALALDIPLIGVNHLQAHIATHFIGNPDLPLPILSLLVSGGHTQIYLIKSPTDYVLLGSTKDDAAGEAFDKGAKMLGIPYPGGPLMDKYSQNGNRFAYPFPTPKTDGLTYSFSGLKTSLLYFLEKEQGLNPEFISENMIDICASFQNRIVSYLLSIFDKAIQEYHPKGIGLAGGVAANSQLRSDFQTLAIKRNIPFYIPDFEYCTDNAGMVSIAAWYKFLEKDFESLDFQPYASGNVGK